MDGEHGTGIKVVRGAGRRFVPASHEDPSDPGVLKRVLYERDDITDGRVEMVNWAVIPAGKSFRRHYHQDMDEIFVIIRGTVSVSDGRGTYALSAGDAILIPERTEHEMTNTGTGKVTYMVIGISRGRNGKTVISGVRGC